jgi:hypothetical protein
VLSMKSLLDLYTKDKIILPILSAI